MGGKSSKSKAAVRGEARRARSGCARVRHRRLAPTNRATFSLRAGDAGAAR